MLYVLCDEVEFLPVASEEELEHMLYTSAIGDCEFGLDVAARVREVVDSTGVVVAYAIVIDPEGFEG